MSEGGDGNYDVGATFQPEIGAEVSLPERRSKEWLKKTGVGINLAKVAGGVAVGFGTAWLQYAFEKLGVPASNLVVKSLPEAATTIYMAAVYQKGIRRLLGGDEPGAEQGETEASEDNDQIEE